MQHLLMNITLLRYGVAVFAVTVAFLLKVLIDPLIIQETPFLLVFAAIMVSAWFGGLGPGLLATFLGALITDYFFLYPRGSFSGLSLEATPLVVFFLEGILVSVLTHALKAARERSEVSTKEARAHQERAEANQEKLRQSEELFRLLVEGVEDYAIFILDPEGHVASWNAGAERTNGYQAGEIIGEHFSRFYTEEDRERGHPEEELRIAVSEGSYEEEGLRVRKDNSRFWASVLIAPLRDEDGNLRGFSKVVRDISERKHSEQRLSDAFNRLLALYETGRILGSSLKREEIGSRLLENMQRVSDFSAAILELRGTSGKWQLLCATGPENLRSWARATPEAQAARQAALDAEEPETFELPHSHLSWTPLCGLCAPLRVRERLVGMLGAYGPPTLAEPESVETIASLAGQAASALENARLYEELAERERELRELVGRMIVAQEDERRRVAYEVHDGLAQIAAAAHQHLQTFADLHPPGSARGQERLTRALELIQQTVKEARRVIADLRPTALDDFGLATALRLHTQEIHTASCQVSYEETLGEERLPVDVETALYRVAQEAITNARKHSESSRIHLSLHRSDQMVRLEVRDWGRGFEAEEVADRGGPGERIGLSSMQERVALLGGALRVQSEPQAGTSVVAEVPLSATSEEGTADER